MTADTPIKTGSKTAGAPRVLVLDMTPIGSLSATGQVKAQLFAGWPPMHLLQVASQPGGGLAVISEGRPEALPLEAIVERCLEFAPEVIYCRPLDSPPQFREAVIRVVRTLARVPLVTHIMDDWPRRMRARAAPEANDVETELGELLARSVHRFAIGEKMVQEFERRYGVPFEPFANCVDRATWQAVVPDRRPLDGEPQPGSPLVLRYSGALAHDMTRTSVYDVARAVDHVARDLPVRFDLSVLPAWKKEAERDLDGLSAVTVRAATRSIDGYRSFVAGADVCVVAYNFDAQTAEYVGLSVANKLPDYLAAGRPILAYGPDELATIELCSRSGAAEVVSERDEAVLVAAIRRLVSDADRRRSMRESATDFIFSVADADDVRTRFRRRLQDASAQRPHSDVTPGIELRRLPRDEHASLDEAALMASLLSRHPRDAIMIDVGAHHGSEMKPFVERGWRVYGFEPDPVNRAHLEDRIRHHPRVHIDPRAVSESEERAVPFFRSEQSTGISTLAPFHDTHFESGTVSTVRLDRFCADRHIDRIDYLKVDTEGHDLFVLRSLDWDVTPPKAIQAEFEDAKTVPLGYDFHDLATFLTDRGYDVWVSEWHPVVAYGTQHDWHRLSRYPTGLTDDRAWGNLLAFRDPVPDEEMRAAAGIALSRRIEQPESSSQQQATARTGSAHMTQQQPLPNRGGNVLHASSVLRSMYPQPADAGLRSRLRELALAYQGQLALPSVAAIVLYLGAVVASGVQADDTNVVPNVLLAAAGILTLGAVGVGITRARRERQRAVADLASKVAGTIDTDSVQNDEAVAALSSRLDEVIARVENLRSELSKAQVETPRADTPAELERLEDRHLRAVRELRTDIATTNERLESVETHLSALEASAPPEPPPATYQSFARSISDDDASTITETWGRRLGLFTDVPPARNAQHLRYLADRIRVAEDRSIGRLATSTQDMLLRMMVARAAARDASEREEPLHVLEIGTLFGIGLGLLGEACRTYLGQEFTLTGVDPLDGYYFTARPDIVTGESVDRDAFSRNMSSFPIGEDRWRIIQHTNRGALDEGSVSDRAYGMVVIDGDHTFDEIRYDFEEYRDLMGTGCYVIFDDYGSEHWPDVARYVDEHVAPRADVQFVGTSWHTVVIRVL